MQEHYNEYVGQIVGGLIAESASLKDQLINAENQLTQARAQIEQLQSLVDGLQKNQHQENSE